MTEFSKKVHIKLSWRQKLLLVIALTLIGLIIVTGSAFTGLNSVNNSFSKQSVAVGYKQNSLVLTNQLLKLETSADTLNSAEAAQFETELDSLESLTLQMQSQSANLGYQKLVEYAKRLQEMTANYTRLSKEWLQNGLALGFSPAEGKLARLSESLTELEKISFSMIDESVAALIFTQSKYLVYKDKINEKKIEELLKTLDNVVTDMDWQENIIGIKITAYKKAFDESKEYISKDKKISVELDALTNKLAALVNEQNQYLEETVILEVKHVAESNKKAAMKIILIAAVIVGCIILISLGSIARQLNIQLMHMRVFLKSAAAGDFSNNLAINNNDKDEFTQLRKASNQMVKDISGVISRVVDGNRLLLNIRTELENAVKQLAATSGEVEQKTQQSTVATQQISLAVNDAAKRSVEVGETAQAATTSTKTGREVISNCVNSMIKIVDLIETTHEEVIKLAESSNEMLGIVDVINGLADKTNLLALNAAIESARAGEAGRGFSVVADEVRELAKKTVSATSSISNIIKNFDSQSKRIGDLMDEGIELASSGQKNANNAMTSIESIEASVQKVATEMEQVVVAVEEISYNTDDIASQVKHICTQSEGTKATRQTLEEHTHRLSSQAEDLEKLTSQFTLPSS